MLTILTLTIVANAMIIVDYSPRVGNGEIKATCEIGTQTCELFRLSIYVSVTKATARAVRGS